MDIDGWLREIGLAQYADLFRANDIDGELLGRLTNNDLKDIGVASLGHRRKLLDAITTLGVACEPPSPTPVDASPAPAAERRQLTVMFVDLVGSTELSQRLDPEEMRDVIRAYQNTVSAEITRYEGRVAKLMGDGILAYFGWPQAHEDDAERAVRAGLGAAAATAILISARGEPLAARIGIATGLVVVGDLVGEGSAQEEAVVGDTPNLAARLQILAEPNTVVIAESTLRLVAGLFDVVDLGHRPLKGFAAPVRAWRAVGEAAAESRFDALHGMTEAPLVGRAEELDLLLQRWRRAKTGEGQVVLLSGEPGIGKSRLIAALHERLGNEPHSRLRYFCSPYHVNSALLPVIKQLERAAGLRHDTSANTKLDKLETLLRQSVSDVAEVAPVVATLLSIDTAGRFTPEKLTPQALKARTLAALIKLLEGLVARQPVVLLVEDVHWIDPTTGEWLDMLIDRLQELPALLIVTFRPEFQPRWTGFSHVTALSLSRLGRDQGEGIIERVAGSKTLPPEVITQILAKTEGVPLFIEELTKTVLESGFLIDAGDHYTLSAPLLSLAIPSTLQDSLMARLDKLASVKEAAQIGACIGRVFDHRLLAAVIGSHEQELEGVLQDLVKSELVHRRGVPPEATYTFKHALVQDTAYQSLLKSRRQQIHAIIASKLEAEFSKIAEAEPETLAHHYTSAGLTEPAVAYWLKAGQRALKRSANREAVAHLGKGLELVAALPDTEARLRQEIHLQSAMGVTMMAARGWGAPEVQQAYSRARALCEKLGDKSQLFAALRGEGQYHMISGNLRAADELGHQCMEIARSSGESAFLLEAHHLFWSNKFFMGDYAAAETHAELGIATYDPSRHHSLTYAYSGHDPGVCCRAFSAMALLLRGFPDRALERCRETMALAEREAHPLTMALAQWAFSYVHLMRREPNAGRLWAEKEVALSEKYVLPLLLSQGKFQLGWALADQGQLTEGIAAMLEGLIAIGATGAEMGMPYFLSILAEAHGRNGQVIEGVALVDRALAVANETGARFQLPELHRARGNLLLRQGPSNASAAEACFTRALQVAREQAVKFSELHAARDLAVLWTGQGNLQKAHDVLTPVYAWFTEGFDTPDLKEAKAFLNELRA